MTLQQAPEIIAADPGIFQYLHKKLRPDTLSRVEREDQGAAIRVGEESVAAAAATFSEARAYEGCEYPTRWQLRQAGHRSRSDDDFAANRRRTAARYALVPRPGVAFVRTRDSQALPGRTR